MGPTRHNLRMSDSPGAASGARLPAPLAQHCAHFSPIPPGEQPAGCYNAASVLRAILAACARARPPTGARRARPRPAQTAQKTSRAPPPKKGQKGQCAMPMPGATPPGLRAPGADRRGRRWQAAAWRAAARSPRRTSPGSRRSRGRGAARCQAGRGYARRRRQTPRAPPPARARDPATRSAPAARARCGAGLSQIFQLAHERGVILIGPTAASRPAWRARAPPPAWRAP